MNVQRSILTHIYSVVYITTRLRKSSALTYTPHEMQRFYATRFKGHHPRGAIEFDFRLNNGPVPNYKYSSGDGHATNSIEPADHVMTAEIVLWSPCTQALLIEPFVNSPYKMISPGTSSYQLLLSSCSFASLPDRGPSSTILVAFIRCIRRSITEWCTTICPAALLLLKLARDTPTACHLSAKVNLGLTIFQY